MVSIGYSCPRCGCPTTRTRRTDDVNALNHSVNPLRDFDYRPPASGVINYCCDCKLAWCIRLSQSGTHEGRAQSLNTNPANALDDGTDEDTFVHASGFAASSASRSDINELCANCNNSIGQKDASFLCSQLCGRSFHITCVRDPLVDTLSCRFCASDPRRGAVYRDRIEPALQDLGSDVNVRDLLSNTLGHPNLDARMPTLDGNWPSKCVYHVDHDPGASQESAALLQEIRTAWNQCRSELPESERNQAESMLDSVTEANLVTYGSRFLDSLLRKVIMIRSHTNPHECRGRIYSGWRVVIQAAQALSIDAEVITNAEQLLFNVCSSVECPTTPIATWSIDDVAYFLKYLQLEKLETSFRQSKIDGQCLLSLTWEDLVDDLEVPLESDIEMLLGQIQLFKSRSSQS